ncbi:hypothetical protein [Bacillus toyonensis]|uniref:hypothetical protein n=1 Tax=Bacillus toyonensis TaxID=155322 RepID=UPI000BFC0EC1|nr:hypothetical protein [Bacillus toyonensis]PHG62760.1 hypothetical protein COI59_19935 [Bacillus toyonensis]
MKRWLKPILCTGIFVSGIAMIGDHVTVYANESALKNNSEMTEFKEIKQISLGTMGRPLFIGELSLAKMPFTIQDLVKTIVVGTENYDPETLGLQYIEIPTEVALLPIDELSKWNLKISIQTKDIATTKKGDAITTKFKVDVKSEFYNEQNELKGTSQYCYFYEKVTYENETGVKCRLVNSMRIG